jgi:hypothetical protein
MVSHDYRKSQFMNERPKPQTMTSEQLANSKQAVKRFEKMAQLLNPFVRNHAVPQQDEGDDSLLENETLVSNH